MASESRHVVAGHFLSLDGVAEAPDQFITAWDDETDAHGAELIARQDAVILGRSTYDEWAGFWPTSEIEPFASFINTVPKYVATSTPLTTEWANARAIEGPVDEFVRTLKAGDGGDIGVHGSISLTQSLLAAGLVDEVRLLVAPRVVGSGRRLFDDRAAAYSLELVESTGSPSGSLLVHYRVVTGD